MRIDGDRARYTVHLTELAESSGLDFSYAEVEAMRMTLACAVRGFQYAFPIAGHRKRIWWLCWINEGSEVNPEFYGKTRLTRGPRDLKILASYADPVIGQRLKRALVERYDEDGLRSLCRGAAKEHRERDGMSDIYFAILTEPKNPGI